LKKNYNISVLGQDLAVSSDAEEEYVNSVVLFVNEKMNEVMRSTKSLKTLDVAILAALNISEEYLKLKGVNNELCGQLEDRAEKLIQLIENAS